jgi:hypothetical protein
MPLIKISSIVSSFDLVLSFKTSKLYSPARATTIPYLATLAEYIPNFPENKFKTKYLFEGNKNSFLKILL